LGLVQSNVACAPDPWLAPEPKAALEFQVANIDLNDIENTDVKLICGNKHKNLSLRQALDELQVQAQREGRAAQRPSDAIDLPGGAKSQATP
jgi:hypothetical protein